MSINKRFLKSKPVCEVTFRIPQEDGKDFKKASLVGDFNNWDTTVHQMKKIKKDGSFSISVDLPTGSEYQFKYLLDGRQWSVDRTADRQVTSHFSNSENSVVSL